MGAQLIVNILSLMGINLMALARSRAASAVWLKLVPDQVFSSQFFALHVFQN